MTILTLKNHTKLTFKEYVIYKLLVLGKKWKYKET